MGFSSFFSLLGEAQSYTICRVNNKDAAVIATTGVSAFLLLAGMVFAEDLRREALVVRPDPGGARHCGY